MVNPPSGRFVPSRAAACLAFAAFAGCLAFHLGAAIVGWQSRTCPGGIPPGANRAVGAVHQTGPRFLAGLPHAGAGKPCLSRWSFRFISTGGRRGEQRDRVEPDQSGAGVSLACFYLMLPAIYLLLARWRVAPGHRWLVLAAVVTCPLYIFYGRAFLIETMALMFSLWFWVGFERAVEERSRVGWRWRSWRARGRGWSKSTTFLLYLLPVALWAGGWLWRHRTDGRWRSGLAWMAVAVAVPFAATVEWVHFSDAVKARNPAAQFLISERMTDFNLGQTPRGSRWNCGRSRRAWWRTT